MSGAMFDQAYMANQVKAHAKMAAMFELHAQKSQDMDVRAFAARNLPIVQEHLRMARQLAGLGAGGTGAGRTSLDSTRPQLNGDDGNLINAALQTPAGPDSGANGDNGGVNGRRNGARPGPGSVGGDVPEVDPRDASGAGAGSGSTGRSGLGRGRLNQGSRQTPGGTRNGSGNGTTQGGNRN